MNDQVRSKIKYSRLDTDDFNVGNTHKNYSKAKYQNLRLRGLFSIYADVLFTGDKTVAKLLDPVYISAENIRYPSKLCEEEGRWIVLSITRVLRMGMVYGEKLTLMRPFINNPGLTDLVQF